jgi:hypothetical protein
MGWVSQILPLSKIVNLIATNPAVVKRGAVYRVTASRITDDDWTLNFLCHKKADGLVRGKIL